MLFSQVFVHLYTDITRSAVLQYHEVVQKLGTCSHCCCYSAHDLGTGDSFAQKPAYTCILAVQSLELPVSFLTLMLENSEYLN
jgi:hypothetical protein